jgi:hypothetical protein
MEPTAQDHRNAATRAEIAARQAEAYAEVLRYALGALGPGWLPSHRHFLLTKEEEERARSTGDKPIAAKTVFTVKNAAERKRHFTVEDGKVKEWASYEEGFGSMLLEPHLGFVGPRSAGQNHDRKHCSEGTAHELSPRNGNGVRHQSADCTRGSSDRCNTSYFELCPQRRVSRMPVAPVSLPAEQQVENPATANVFGVFSAMVQNVGIVAAGVFEGVGKDGHTIKGTLIVDVLCDAANRAVVPGEPVELHGDGTEWVPEDVTEKVTLMGTLNLNILSMSNKTCIVQVACGGCS